MAYSSIVVLPKTLVNSDFNAGTIADIDEGTSSPDANWLTVVDTAASPNAEIAFNDPGGFVVGPQSIGIYLRKYNTTGGSDPTCDLTLQEYDSVNGTLQNEIAFTQQTFQDNTTGFLLTFNWNHNNLTYSKQARFLRASVTIGSNGGGPNQRSGELGAIQWNAQIKPYRKIYTS